MLIIVPVHGTGDGVAYSSGGAKAWWRPDSEYAQLVMGSLHEAEIVEGREYVWAPFKWGGLNSERDRLKASRDLSEFLISQVRNLRPVNLEEIKNLKILIIAHSHGGNVAVDAMAELNGKAESCPRAINSILSIALVSIGTSVWSTITNGPNAICQYLMKLNYKLMENTDRDKIHSLTDIVRSKDDDELKKNETIKKREKASRAKTNAIIRAYSPKIVADNARLILIGTPFLNRKEDLFSFFLRWVRSYSGLIILYFPLLISPSILFACIMLAIQHGPSYIFNIAEKLPNRPHWGNQILETLFGTSSISGIANNATAEISLSIIAITLLIAIYITFWIPIRQQIWRIKYMERATTDYETNQFDQTQSQDNKNDQTVNTPNPGNTEGTLNATTESPKYAVITEDETLARVGENTNKIHGNEKTTQAPGEDDRVTIDSTPPTQVNQTFVHALLGATTELKLFNPDVRYRQTDDQHHQYIDKFFNKKSPISSAIILHSRHDEAILALHRLVSLDTVPLAQPNILLPVGRWALLIILLALILLTTLLHMLTGFPRWPDWLQTGYSPTAWSYLATSMILLLSAILGRPSANLLSALMNRVAGTVLRARALGDDHFARPVESVTPYLQVSFADRWAPLPRALDEHVNDHTGYAAQAAWRHMREALVVAQFTGNRDLFETIENTGGATWDTLVHTCYFREPLLMGFIAYVTVDRITNQGYGLIRQKSISNTEIETFIEKKLQLLEETDKYISNKNPREPEEILNQVYKYSEFYRNMQPKST